MVRITLMLIFSGKLSRARDEMHNAIGRDFNCGQFSLSQVEHRSFGPRDLFEKCNMMCINTGC